ncbi:MAG: phosphonopyruvate decarboxylase [Chitinophagaceae bacterium]|nr:MAG: phosphonopyruvate decarboxylase [Chitinophagaceae bacterium]
MIEAAQFIQALEENGVGFFTGVPDSLLSSFSAALQPLPRERHLIAANEGAAIALAAGYHLATGGLPLVYLQNSGLGNLVNPLTSLLDETVYGIPVVLLVGWRGQPGTKDEPQHGKMGAATVPLLETLGVPVRFLRVGDEDVNTLVTDAAREARERSAPVAIVVEKGALGERSLPQQEDYPLSSSAAIGLLSAAFRPGDKVLCSTGKIGRAFYSWNERQGNPVDAFLNVGAMGHTGSLAAALALHSDQRIWLLDGDGALLMHLGALGLIGSLQLKNLNYILLNNGAHESVGRQPTLGFNIDFCAVARACGFAGALLIENEESLRRWLSSREEGLFVEIRINTRVPADLPRPAGSLKEAGGRFRSSFQKSNDGAAHTAG